MLDAVAVLAGFSGRVGDITPDGLRPDVVRVRPGGRAIFVGDAKATERPGGGETVQRLGRYVRCFVALTVPLRPWSIFAVCGEAGWPWTKLVRDLVESARVAEPRIDYLTVGSDCIAWFLTCPGTVTWRPSRPGRARGHP